MSKTNRPDHASGVARLEASAHSAAGILLSIGWLGGLLAYLFVSEFGTWWAWCVAVAVVFLCSAWGRRISRSHTLHAAIIGAAMATSDIERRKHE